MNIGIQHDTPIIETKTVIEIKKLQTQINELKTENTKLRLDISISKSLFFVSIAIVFIILNIQHYIKLEMPIKSDIIEFTLLIVAWSVVILGNTMLIISNIIVLVKLQLKKQN